MSRFPSFTTFYAAANGGRAPFPWQSRLAERVAAEGWPGEIGVPTGLGKTACIDIAVWALASQAARPARERTLPTRVWYVVNRRLLVDAAYDHGENLERLLAHPWRPWHDATGEHVAALAAVADGLRRIRGRGGVDDTPLVVTRLRGGAELGARAPHPAHPALVFATVPMFASAWLFRGYSSSAGMRPVDAAHAGIDSLVLLDEAHLARPLRDLVGPVAECDIGDPGAVVHPARSRPTLVSVTATGDADAPFLLDAADEAHTVVRQRLDAAKPVRLVGVEKKAGALGPDLVESLTDELADEKEPVAVVVFTNTASGARDVFNRLRRLQAKRGSPLAGARLRLLTGRMRRRESDAVRAELLDPRSGAASSRDRAAPRGEHLVVVATQTLEVGADLDFDVLVTESCGTRALVQRLGRLNRLGVNPRARGVVVHPCDETSWPVYGEEPALVWARLTDVAGDERLVDLPPSAVSDVLGAPDDAPGRVGELLPAHLWEWAKTTTPPPGEAPVELFFEGFGGDGARVSICWRVTPFEPGDRLVPGVSVDESVDVPLSEAREALTARLGGDADVLRLARDRVTVERVPVGRVEPSDVVVLHPSDGLYDDFGWDPEADGSTEVLDVSLARWPGMPLDLPSIVHWTAPTEARDEMAVLLKQLGADDVDPGDLAPEARSVLRRLEPRVELGEDHARAWDEVVRSLRLSIEWPESVPVLVRDVPRRRRGTVLVAADAFDDLSAAVRSMGLDDHLASVGAIAGDLARSVGLADPLVAAVEAAGRFHDLGKSDPRFQRWLDPRGEAAGPLAKSASSRLRWRADRAASGWPAGGRHEALSARMVERWTDENGGPPWDRDLVTHLVISHHGYGRPLVAPVDDLSPTRCTGTIDGASVAVSGDLSETDWDQPARFRRCCERYGYWGLALLEAVVRQADHMASSAVGAPVEVA